jgi:hypothetical protein
LDNPNYARGAVQLQLLAQRDAAGKLYVNGRKHAHPRPSRRTYKKTSGADILRSTVDGVDYTVVITPGASHLAMQSEAC